MPVVAPMLPSRDFRAVMLRSDRMLLRSFVPGDAPEIFMHALPAISHYMNWAASPSLESFETVWRAWLADLAEGREPTLVARYAESLEFLGIAGLHFNVRGEAEAGVWIKDPARGQGYGAEAVAAIVAWACQTLGLEAVLFAAVESNTASCRIAEVLGGVPVGRRAQHHPSGPSTAMVVYRIPGAPRAGVASVAPVARQRPSRTTPSAGTSR